MNTLKITLACAGGMSTSLLCKKIITASEKKGFEKTECNAYPVAELKNAAPGSNVILLGPQIAYEEKKVKAQFPDIPVIVIPMTDYGMMNGEKIFNDLADQFGW